MTTIKPFHEFFEQKHFPFSSVFFPGTFCLSVSLSFLFFNINLYSLPVGVSPGTTDQFSTCLSAICFVYIFQTGAKKQKEPWFWISLSLILYWSNSFLLYSFHLFLQVLQCGPELRRAKPATEHSRWQLLAEGWGVWWCVAWCNLRSQSSCLGAGGKGHPIVCLTAFDR